MKVNLAQVGRSLLRAFRRNSPHILTGVGIVGMIGTVVLAVKETPKAMSKIEEAKKAKNVDKLSWKDKIRAGWKSYIPAGVTGAASIACIIGANTIHGRRTAALMAAASMAENTLKEYRSKVIETIGEKKEDAILTKVNEEQIKNNPPPKNIEVPANGGPLVLCYDTLFGRYFYSSRDRIEKAANRINWDISHFPEGDASLNDFYVELGLSPVDVGDHLGWNNKDGKMIELKFSSHLSDAGEPCLAFKHLNPPKYGYGSY